MTLDRGRAAKACFPAAGTGGAICGLQFLAITGGFTGTNASLASVLTWGLIVFWVSWLVASVAFLIGLHAVGISSVALLERRRQATPLTVAIQGSLLSGAVAGTFGAIAGGAYGATTSATFLLLPGASAGLVFHLAASQRGASRP
ncbi:hypothetical protein [Brevundimonas sp.]|uniref:hypothetical protein n=1 Tax=Brevundimonas sp. TaxID=1871086 RepID=UPI002D3053C5|nr:hypothetical protein [Brevundimonas sp.]HYC68606.1 hypothetical protein [Brevundimonas sp.]